MKVDIESRLIPTESRHSHMVDAYAYMVASHYAKLADDYLLLHINPCPKWMPSPIYKWILSKVMILTRFK